MTSVVFEQRSADVPASRSFWLSSPVARVGFICVLAFAALAGLIGVNSPAASSAVAEAGGELTNLLRLMAVLKGVMAAGAAAAVFWRLGAGLTLLRFFGYAAACGAMATGPGLIWAMAHVGLGALLLHGGLFATGVLLWRDPSVARRLETLVRARRRPFASGAVAAS